MNERDILRIANNLMNGDAIYSDDDLKIAQFFDFINLSATHQYLIKEIKESYTCFTISLINLEKFMGKHFIHPIVKKNVSYGLQATKASNSNGMRKDGIIIIIWQRFA